MTNKKRNSFYFERNKYPGDSGVTLLEGARGHGMVGCPMIKKRLRKVQKTEVRNMRELCGVGSKGRSPQKGLCFSMQKQHFQRKFHRLRKISNMGGGASNNCKRSEQTERLCEALTGVQGAGSRKFCILRAKYA